MSKQLITFKLHLLSWPLPLHRYLAVCFMPITCLCGCAYLSFAASVCSCLICEPWFSVSLTPSYQVRLETNFLWKPHVLFFIFIFSHIWRREMCYCCLLTSHVFLAGVLVLFLGFFAFLHCWLNAFAEMLRFADRMFYKVLVLPSF